MRAHRAIRFEGRVSTAQFFLRSLLLEVSSESGVQISGANQPPASFEAPNNFVVGEVASDESERTDGRGISPAHRADVADRDWQTTRAEVAAQWVNTSAPVPQSSLPRTLNVRFAACASETRRSGRGRERPTGPPEPLAAHVIAAHSFPTVNDPSSTTPMSAERS